MTTVRFSNQYRDQILKRVHGANRGLFCFGAVLKAPIPTTRLTALPCQLRQLVVLPVSAPLLARYPFLINLSIADRLPSV